MITTAILYVVGVVAIFTIGVAVGAHNAVTVDNAIAKIKTTEQGAQAVLAKITAHKAS